MYLDAIALRNWGRDAVSGMLHFPGYYVGFFHFFRYFRCFLIAPDGCWSGKTAFVKVRFARIARFAVFFDSAYRAV